MSNFWQELPKPIFILAPMEAVTDCAFREIFAKYGNGDESRSMSQELGSKNQELCESHKSTELNAKRSKLNAFVMFTEFVNVDGLLHPEGFKKLKIDLEFTEKQRPIVAQIWGRDPEKFYSASKLLTNMGFDGIDINMGCPQEKEITQKTCAALIREPNLAGEIIEATIRGAQGFPVSVKTRLGYSKPEEMEGWLSHLLKYPLSAITLHARTKQEKSKVPAHWEKIKEAVGIRNRKNYELGIKNYESKTLIIGNGDIKTREEALMRIKETGCDGVMIGRGAFGSPWIFNSAVGMGFKPFPTIQERLSVMLEHALLYEKMYSGVKHFVQMRKNFKAYANGFLGASELRAKLMETNNAEEVRKIVEEFLKNNQHGSTD